MNTQTDMLNLFLPVIQGTPKGGAAADGGKSQLAGDDFLQFLLGSVPTDPNAALLLGADVSGEGDLANQVSAGSEELSDLDILNPDNQKGLVFGAWNLNPDNKEVTNQDTIWDKFIVSKGWQVGQAENAALPATDGAPADENSNAGRIVDPMKVFTGNSPMVPSGTQSNGGGQIVITGTIQSGNGATVSDERLNHLAENLAVSTADITQAQPEQNDKAAILDASQKPVWPEMSPMKTLQIHDSEKTESEKPLIIAGDSESAENEADGKNVVKAINDDVSSGELKKDAKGTTEATQVKSSVNSVDSSRPAAHTATQASKVLPTGERYEAPAVRFILPENFKDNVVRPGHTITLHMEPDHLGSVRLTLTSHQDSLIGRVVVDSPAAKMAVVSNLHVLQNQLSNEGLNLQQFQVSVGGEQAQQFTHGNMPHGNGSAGANLSTSEQVSASSAAVQSAIYGGQGGYVNAGGVNWLA